MNTTWADMSGESLEGAKLLREQGRDRSTVSRAYFSAYAALAGELDRLGVRGAGSRPNPSHAQLAMLARHNLDRNRFDEGARKRVARSIRLLRGLRVAADYDPTSSIGNEEALLALREASALCKAVTG